MQQHQNEQVSARLGALFVRQEQARQRHRRQTRALKDKQQNRWIEEIRARQSHFRRGLLDFLDRLSGARAKIQKRNELEAIEAARRDQGERDILIFKQLEESRQMNARGERLEAFKLVRESRIERDIAQYRQIKAKRRDVFKRDDRQASMRPQLER